MHLCNTPKPGTARAIFTESRNSKLGGRAEMSDTKTCSRCGEEKPLSGYTAVANGKFGVASQCKACLAKISRLRRTDREWKDSEFGRTHFGRVVEPGEVVTARSCTKCLSYRPLSEFYQNANCKHGVTPVCRECTKVDAVVRRQSDIGKARTYGREYYAANRDKLLQAANDSRSTPRGKIDNAISCGVSRGIKKGSKNGRASFELIGYTLEQLMSHLAAQFDPWMSWDNYGFYGWHIDHIRPLASFHYDTPDDPEFKEAWALSNLRPLRSTDNWRKGASYQVDNDNAKTAHTEGESRDYRPIAA